MQKLSNVLLSVGLFFLAMEVLFVITPQEVITEKDMFQSITLFAISCFVGSIAARLYKK